MQNPTTMTLSPADVQSALAYWLNHQVLKAPVVVEEVRQRSSKASQPGFELVVRPAEPAVAATSEETEGTCASSYPAASE
jgi:hypothetical protein